MQAKDGKSGLAADGWMILKQYGSNSEVAFLGEQSLSDSNSCTIHHIEMLQELGLQKEWNIEMIWGQEQVQEQRLQEQNCFRLWSHSWHHRLDQLCHTSFPSKSHWARLASSSHLFNYFNLTLGCSYPHIDTQCLSIFCRSQLGSATDVTIAHPKGRQKAIETRHPFLPTTWAEMAAVVFK